MTNWFYFLANLIALIVHIWEPNVTLPFTITSSNILLAQILLMNWLLMILLYILQINVAMCTQYGQATTSQIWLSLASYFTYSQLFIVVSIHAVCSVCCDRIFHRDGTKWVKTKRFADSWVKRNEKTEAFALGVHRNNCDFCSYYGLCSIG